MSDTRFLITTRTEHERARRTLVWS